MLARLICLLKGHDMAKDDRIRLLVLNDSWPPDYTDGLPRGLPTKCSRCGERGVLQVQL